MHGTRYEMLYTVAASLSPDADDGHDGRTKINCKEEGSLAFAVVCSEDGISVHLEGHKLDVCIVKEDASRKRVKDALGKDFAPVIVIERVADADADCDADGRHQRIE